MASPEVLPQSPHPPEVTPRVEQPLVPESVSGLGVSAIPQTPSLPPASLQTPIATQAQADNIGPALSVPQALAQSQDDLIKGAKGPANASITWLDVYWLREVKKAILKGWKILFGVK